jgi:hypothetical protein
MVSISSMQRTRLPTCRRRRVPLGRYKNAPTSLVARRSSKTLAAEEREEAKKKVAFAIGAACEMVASHNIIRISSDLNDLQSTPVFKALVNVVGNR